MELVNPNTMEPSDAPFYESVNRGFVAANARANQDVRQRGNPDAPSSRSVPAGSVAVQLRAAQPLVFQVSSEVYTSIMISANASVNVKTTNEPSGLVQQDVELTQMGSAPIFCTWGAMSVTQPIPGTSGVQASIQGDHCTGIKLECATDTVVYISRTSTR